MARWMIPMLMMLVSLASGLVVFRTSQPKVLATRHPGRQRICLSAEPDADETSSPEAEDTEFAKRLQYEAALKEAILEQQKPKPPNRFGVVAGFLAIGLTMGFAINWAFSPAADSFTGRLK
eukprot:scaffold18145_cov35-Tisochrysis_lutea.AAC.9